MPPIKGTIMVAFALSLHHEYFRISTITSNITIINITRGITKPRIAFGGEGGISTFNFKLAFLFCPIPPEARNVGTYFIMAAISETEIERFKDVTLHPGSKLITRLPKACSFIFSPYWYPEPFFIRHRKVSF